jgi:hypothetical protein
MELHDSAVPFGVRGWGSSCAHRRRFHPYAASRTGASAGDLFRNAAGQGCRIPSLFVKVSKRVLPLAEGSYGPTMTLLGDIYWLLVGDTGAHSVHRLPLL